MATLTKSSSGTRILQELQEFALLPASAQRYIRRSLEVGSGCREDRNWLARNPEEARSIEIQASLYARVEEIRHAIPIDEDSASTRRLLDALAPLTAFDLGDGSLTSFAAYRFLYERLIGAAVRPWLLSAFCAAAASPTLHPDHRLVLLCSVGELAAGARGWSIREPLFFPDWMEESVG